MYTLYTHICIHSQRYVYVYSVHIHMYITYMCSSNFGINLMNCSSLISKLKFVETTACLTLQMCLKDWLITSHTLCMRPQEPFWYWQTHKIYQTAHFTNVQKKKAKKCVCVWHLCSNILILRGTRDTTLGLSYCVDAHPFTLVWPQFLSLSPS